MTELNGPNTQGRQPKTDEQPCASDRYGGLILKSFGLQPEQCWDTFRGTLLWTLMLVSGCRPFISERSQQFDQEPLRAVATAPLNPGAKFAVDEDHHTSHLLDHRHAGDTAHSRILEGDTSAAAGNHAARQALIERTEPLMVHEVHDRLVLELMMLSKSQADELLALFPSASYPQQEVRIQLLCDYAVKKGYAQADIAEVAHHSYLFIETRASCTGMLEVQLSGYQASLSDRAMPTASNVTIHSEDPIVDALRLLASMSEAILLTANGQGADAKQAASATHPGTVMARDLARMLVDPPMNVSHTRSDLEHMAQVTLDTYCKVTGDTRVTQPYLKAISAALDVTLIRRAGILAQELQHDSTALITAAKESNILVYFDINGDGSVSRSELSPLAQRYNTELVEALQGLAVPTSAIPLGRHGGEH